MRLNWSQRHGPDEFDDTAPSEVSYAFDLRRDARPGAPSSWPAKVNGQTFGPSFVKRAWQSGLVVIAEIEGFPHPVAAQEVRWGAAGVLEVKTLEGFKIPSRLFTRTSAKGLDSTGLLINEGE